MLFLICSLHTRIAYVQDSEKSLEEKRQHREYSISSHFSKMPDADGVFVDIKVVQAFEMALSLLGGS